MARVKFSSDDDADEINYKNNKSKIPADDVQGAIDFLMASKEPADSSILKNSHIGNTVQGYNSHLNTINQTLSTTSNVLFSSLSTSQSLSTAGSFLTLNSSETIPTKNAGLIINRGTEQNAGIMWDETTNEWYISTGSDNKKIWHDGNIPEPWASGNYTFPSNYGRQTVIDRDIPQVLQTDETGSVIWADKVDSGWRDITSEINVRDSKSSSPVWEQLGNLTDIYAYNFSISKEGWSTFHIDHDYKPGGEIYIHIHWTTNGTDTRSVKWQIDYTVAKGHNQSVGGTFTNPTTVFLEQNSSGTAYRHMITEMPSSINVSNAEVDSIILVHIKRVSNGISDNTDKVYGLTVDCHYQCDRFSTPNKSPNFYGE